jgi:ABC-type iron transport system FetAB permease component
MPSIRARILFAAIASVVLLVIAEVGLGWSLDAQERSFVVLVVLLVTFGGAWFLSRVRGGKDEAT